MFELNELDRSTTTVASKSCCVYNCTFLDNSQKQVKKNNEQVQKAPTQKYKELFKVQVKWKVVFPIHQLILSVTNDFIRHLPKMKTNNILCGIYTQIIFKATKVKVVMTFNSSFCFYLRIFSKHKEQKQLLFEKNPIRLINILSFADIDLAMCFSVG
jgi:hypothetical protein